MVNGFEIALKCLAILHLLELGLIGRIFLNLFGLYFDLCFLQLIILYGFVVGVGDCFVV